MHQFLIFGMNAAAFMIADIQVCHVNPRIVIPALCFSFYDTYILLNADMKLYIVSPKYRQSSVRGNCVIPCDHTYQIA